MKKLLANFDWGIFLSLSALLVLGLAMVRSVAPSLFSHQLANVVLSLGLFFLFSQIDFRVYPSLKFVFYGLSLLSLIVTFVFGGVTRGSVRWLQLGSFTLQPSELVKPFLILTLAAFLISRPIRDLKSLLANLLLLFFPGLMIFLQPDLGSSLVVVFFWLVMVLAKGAPKRLVILVVLAGLIFLPLGWFGLQPYQQSRITTFINPFSDQLGSGYNMIQSMVAVGSGRLTGRGLGRGTQSHLNFLPERHTDFIFASLSEELGFLGSLFLILVYGFLLWRILKVARSTKEKLGFLICLGVFSLFFFQVFVNLGMNLGLVPITGITLPLVSFGGSSLMASLICLGVVENIARFD